MVGERSGKNRILNLFSSESGVVHFQIGQIMHNNQIGCLARRVYIYLRAPRFRGVSEEHPCIGGKVMGRVSPPPGFDRSYTKGWVQRVSSGAVGNGGGEGYGDLGLTVLEGASRKGDLDNGLGILDTGTGSLQFGLEGYSISCDRTDSASKSKDMATPPVLVALKRLVTGVMTPAAVSTTPTSTV